MIKSCKNCVSYQKTERYCFKFKTIIIDTISASVCKYYHCKKIIPEKVKCTKCSNMNKYGYCYERRICFTEDERTLDRKCSKFRIASKKIYKK